MPGHHVGVHHEPAGGDHHGRGAHRAGLVVPPPRDARNGAGRGDHEVGRAGLVAHLDAGLLDPVAQQVHQDLGALGVARHRHLVAARRRPDRLAERPDLLVAGEHQALGAGLDDGLGGVVGALELEPQRLQPREVLDRPFAVGADLRLVGLLGARHQVADHVVDGVVVPGGALHGGAAAEVEVPTRHARRAAVHGGPLQEQHPRARPRRLQRRAAAGDAEPDDDHVEGLGVGGDLGRGTVAGTARPERSVMAPI